MQWFFTALIAPLSWTVVGFIDKYLVEKYAKETGVGALMIFSTAIGIVVIPILLLLGINAFHVSIPNAAIMIASGMLYTAYLWPYFKALSLEDNSIVSPMFQMSTPISYVLGFIFLSERLSILQIIASIIIIAGIVGLSIGFKKGRLHFKLKVIFLMFLASLIFSLSVFLFKYFAVENYSYGVVFFWENIGFVVLAFVFFFFIKSYRRDFLNLVKTSGKVIIGLNLVDEVFAVLAKFVLNLASMFLPLALAMLATGLQPFFVFIGGILLTIFVPRFIKEDLSKKILLRKFVFIVVIFVGLYLLTFQS